METQVMIGTQHALLIDVHVKVSRSGTAAA